MDGDGCDDRYEDDGVDPLSSQTVSSDRRGEMGVENKGQQVNEGEMNLFRILAQVLAQADQPQQLQQQLLIDGEGEWVLQKW